MDDVLSLWSLRLACDEKGRINEIQEKALAISLCLPWMFLMSLVNSRDIGHVTENSGYVCVCLKMQRRRR